jgi:5-methyltetrahydrofolate--homocysteine methyltransferase
MTDILQQVATSLYRGEVSAVPGLVQLALTRGMQPQAILNKGLIAGMDGVGRDFKSGDLFVPEVLIAAKAMRAGLEILRPMLPESDVPTAHKCVIGTVKGDLHNIGKNLVGMMLEGAGFETIDLGVDVPADVFVAAVREYHPQILAMSALLTTTMPQMRVTIEALKEAGLRDSVQVLVGGAPVTSAFTEEIEADGYAPDAAVAVDVARTLVK